MTKLDELLKKIDPKNTIDYFNAILDKALNSYHYSTSSIGEIDKLLKVLGDFYWYMEKKMLGLDKDIEQPEDMRIGFCEEILLKVYGRHYRTAVFDIAKSGVEGGLYSILKKIGEAMARKSAEHRIEIEAANFCNELMNDFTVYEQTVKEYAHKYGHLLPERLIEGGTVDLKINFYEVLKNHPYLVKRMREIGKM
jgi:hypothetical protein